MEDVQARKVIEHNDINSNVNSFFVYEIVISYSTIPIYTFIYLLNV